MKVYTASVMKMMCKLKVVYISMVVRKLYSKWYAKILCVNKKSLLTLRSKHKD